MPSYTDVAPATPVTQADEPTIDSRGIAFLESESKLVKYFGDYELLNVIARGGMGIVYKARQVSLNRIVALKMILSGEFASKEEVDRFYSEAKAAALLDHPGIVPIYEVGEHEGKHFFSMTYVEGSSLAAKLNDGPLEPVQAASTIEVSEAVHYAHEQGVIHRDLKPSNILLDMQGRPRVTDFGLAKRLAEDTGMTVSGQVLGTPSYMPPEQAAGHINTIGPASDVYGLGAVLYSLATGRPPFQAASKIDTLRQVVEKEPVAPRQLNSAIPRDLETIILKCLEKSLPRRYVTANELSDELQRFIEGRPILARPIGRVAKVWRWCRRQPMVASLLAAVFLSLILGIGVSSYYAIKESKERKEQERQKNIANEATKKAESARAEKERQAEIAEQERDRAKASETKTRRNLYVSDAERIEVSGGAIPGIHFPILVRVKGLIELELGPNVSIHEQVWPIGDIQKLRRLKLGSLNGIDQLAQLQKLKNLESLDYTSGVGIDVLAKALPQLKSLACPKQYSKQLTEAIPFLQSLEILTIPNSSDKDFGPNLAKLKNLKRLNVLGFPAYVSRQDLEKLQAALPGVTVEGIKK